MCVCGHRADQDTREAGEQDREEVPVFDGVYVWPATRPAWRQRLMEALPTSEAWGIAGRLEKRLNGYGVRSIWYPAVADPVQVRKWFDVR